MFSYSLARKNISCRFVRTFWMNWTISATPGWLWLKVCGQSDANGIDVWSIPLKKHCEIGHLAVLWWWQLFLFKRPIFHLHMGAIFTQLQVGDDCTKATEWGYSSAGQSLGGDFGAKISQQFFRSCSSGWPTKASRSAELQTFLFLGWAVDQSDGKIQALYDFKYRFIGNEVPSTSMELWFC